MKAKSIEKLDLGGLQYERFEVVSERLRGPSTVGFLRPSSATNDNDIQGSLYFLHAGIGDDRHPIASEMVAALTPETIALLSETKTQMVFPFIGLSCLVDPEDLTKGSYYRHFAEEVLNWAEAGTATKDSSRSIAGASAGGYAALHFFLKNLPMFSGCGLHFPMVLTFDFTSSTAIDAYAARMNVDPNLVQIAANIFKEAFASFEAARHADPVSLLRSASASDLNGKRFYLDVGLLDEFGLVESARAIHANLLEKSVAHEYRELDSGRHDETFLRAEFPALIKALIGD